MSKSVDEIANAIRALAQSDKEHLLRVLLEEIDGPPDAEAERLWLDEIRRRSTEIDEGVVETIPAEVVFAELDARYARR